MTRPDRQDRWWPVSFWRTETEILTCSEVSLFWARGSGYLAPTKCSWFSWRVTVFRPLTSHWNANDTLTFICQWYQSSTSASRQLVVSIHAKPIGDQKKPYTKPVEHSLDETIILVANSTGNTCGSDMAGLSWQAQEKPDLPHPRLEERQAYFFKLFRMKFFYVTTIVLKGIEL